jgi:hypothetical protein
MLGRQAFGLAAHRLCFAMPPIRLSLQRERLSTSQYRRAVSADVQNAGIMQQTHQANYR